MNFIFLRFTLGRVEEKSDISAKIEVGKHLFNTSSFSANNSDVMMSPTSNQIVESHGLFWRHLKSCAFAWLNVIIGM